MSDPLEPMDTEDAVRYAVDAGLHSLPTAGGASNHPTQVVKAFLRNAPLDEILEANGTVRTKDVEAALKHYLGRELRSLARRRGVKPETLCDVKDRTLFNWENVSENG